LTTSENVKITTVKIPGSEIGKTMRTKALNREQPSISAASSRPGALVQDLDVHVDAAGPL
jgi:hypothetical protein